MNVLIIDDDKDDVDLFKEAVHELNPEISCWSAQDGVIGFKMLTEDLVVLPDFIFLDVNMPIMGGHECLAKIKATPRLKGIPVFMYSTTRNDREILQYQRLGAEDFIVKPAEFSKLVGVIKSILLKRQRIRKDWTVARN
jgi:CheY-like chemotaxis protein